MPSMTYYERQGWDACVVGKSRVCEYRGSAGAEYRRGWDACKEAKEASK